MTATYGYAEGLYAIFKETDPTSSAIKVEVKKSGDSTYTPVADELVRVGGKMQVPCLFIDGNPMYESLDIIQWLKDNPQN